MSNREGDLPALGFMGFVIAGLFVLTVVVVLAGVVMFCLGH